SLHPSEVGRLQQLKQGSIWNLQQPGKAGYRFQNGPTPSIDKRSTFHWEKTQPPAPRLSFLQRGTASLDFHLYRMEVPRYRSRYRDWRFDTEALGRRETSSTRFWGHLS